MISRLNRFHGLGSLRFVYRTGKTVRVPWCAIKYGRNQRIKSFRVAVVVSKKVSKSAVVRNRIRRRVYEVVRMHEAHITEPYDVVITVFSDQAAEMPVDQMRRDIARLLKQSGIVA